jgi:hypothetical protein
MRELFGFAPVSLEELLICIIGGAVSVIWFEIFKVVQARKSRPCPGNDAMTG